MNSRLFDDSAEDTRHGEHWTLGYVCCRAQALTKIGEELCIEERQATSSKAHHDITPTNLRWDTHGGAGMGVWKKGFIFLGFLLQI
jgi:hypothetical protein